MSFREWLSAQHNRGDWVGELARAYRTHGLYPRTHGRLRKLLEQKGETRALEALRQAVMEWKALAVLSPMHAKVWEGHYDGVTYPALFRRADGSYFLARLPLTPKA